MSRFGLSTINYLNYKKEAFMNENNVAVIDVGTLKSKFEIRQYDKSMNSKVLFRDKKLTVMGRDLDKNGNMILDESVNLVIEALNEFKNKMSEHQVKRYRAVTTDAIRRAANAKEVLDRIEDATGIRLETLSHEDEARMIFQSISVDFPDKLIAVADIGGGSVQVVIGKNEEILELHLFKTGAYYLQQNFSKTHHPTKRELDNTAQFIKGELISLGESKYKSELLVYGTSNIIDFMKAMDIEMKKNVSSISHPYSVDVEVLRPVYNKIVALSYEERMPLFPAEPYYMWSAENALLNVFQICESLKIKRVVPSNNNISSAILYELASI